MAALKIYLDVSCLNRPYDDQTQLRVQLESEAITLILQRADRGEWIDVSSEMAIKEIDAMPAGKRKGRVQALLPDPEWILPLTPELRQRGEMLEALGFKPADAVHVAAAEMHQAAVLLACDDQLCKTAARQAKHLKVLVANPLDWLKEQSNVDDD